MHQVIMNGVSNQRLMVKIYLAMKTVIYKDIFAYKDVAIGNRAFPCLMPCLFISVC